MASLQDVLSALKKADQAGNVEDAKKLALIARQMQGEQSQGSDTPPAAIPQGGTIADPLGQGLSFGFSDEIAGGLGASANSVASLLGKGTGDSFGEAYRSIRDIARENNAAFSERNPGTALAAELGGGALTGGFGAARSGAFNAVKNAPNMLGKLRPIIATGGIQGGIFGAGKSESDSIRGVARDAAQGAAIGATTAPIIPLLAGGTKSAAQRVFQTTSNSPTFQKAVKVLRDKVGIKTLTTGQATGSRPIKSAETTISETLFGHSIGKRLDDNRRKLQSKLFEMAGFVDDDVKIGEMSQEALNRTSVRFSSRYNKLLGGKSVRLDTDDFINDIAEVEFTHTKLLPFQQKKQIRDIVGQFLDVAIDGPISGDKYQSIRSSLAKLERDNASRPTFAGLYRGLKKSLDDAFAKQSGVGAAKKVVDREYNRFIKLRDTFEGSGSIQNAGGELSLSMLLKKAAKRGKGADDAFNEIIRAGQAVLGDPTPNSATASRLANLMFGGSAVAGGFDAGLATVGLPVGTSLALSRGITGSGGITKAIQSGLITAPITNSLLGNFQ